MSRDPDEVELDFSRSLAFEPPQTGVPFGVLAAMVMLVSSIGFSGARRRYHIGDFEVVPVGLDWVELDLMPGRDRIAFLDPTRSRR